MDPVMVVQRINSEHEDQGCSNRTGQKGARDQTGEILILSSSTERLPVLCTACAVGWWCFVVIQRATRGSVRGCEETVVRGAI